MLECISYLLHFSVFGILGVGSFLMGWWGVVFKPDIAGVSDQLAMGLTTGYLGSVRTFSGWNQKMLDLVVIGHWVYAVVGFILGDVPLPLHLFNFLLYMGFTYLNFETFMNYKKLTTSLYLQACSWQRIPSNLALAQLSLSSHFSKDQAEMKQKLGRWRVDSFERHAALMVALVIILAILLSVSGVFLKEFNSGSSEAQLWLACLVGAPGVWTRWFLARLNGRGLGKAGYLKWVPFGTLIANVSAACIMAALSTVKKAVDTKTCITISSGIQFGFLGCLSTVSTFVAE